MTRPTFIASREESENGWRLYQQCLEPSMTSLYVVVKYVLDVVDIHCLVSMGIYLGLCCPF